MESLAIVLAVTGVVLLAVEIFVPGFGIFGMLGILLTLLSAIITAICIPFGIFIVIGLGAVLLIFFMALAKFFKNKQMYSRLILTDTLSVDLNEFDNMDFFLGKEGITITPLRPYGNADFDGERVEVLSAGPYIPKGKYVKVVQVSKNKIIVEEMRQ